MPDRTKERSSRFPEVRDMRKEDLRAVLDLEHRVFDAPWTMELFVAELERPEKSIYLLAELDGLVLAYSGAQVIGNEVHLTNMAVAPEERRKGIGSALLVATARRGMDLGARWLTLEVREGNADARSFYRGFAFEEIGLRRGYYTDTGEDAVIMVTGDIRSDEYLGLLDRLGARAGGRRGER